jgi:hypothetical protein
MSNFVELIERQADSREAVDRFVRGLEGAGEPPRGWTTARLVDGYVEALRGFSPLTVDAAAARLVTTRTRHTWPLPGEVAAAAKACAAEEPPPPAEQAPAARAGIQAHEWVRGRLTTPVVLEALEKRSLPELRAWMWAAARDSIRAGVEPFLPDASISAQLDELAGQASATPAMAGTLGGAARRVVDQAREAAAQG